MSADDTTPRGADSPTPDRGATVSARDVRLLIEGLRSWYRSVAASGRRSRSPRSVGALGLLIGPRGSGKSLLISALEQVCQRLGFLSVVRRCGPAPEAPLSVAVDLLRGLQARLWAAGDHGLSAAERRVIAAVVPGFFEGLTGDACVPPPLPHGLARGRLVDVFARAILSFASTHPVVLVIDDLHALDRTSRDVLSACLRIAARRRGKDGAPHILVIGSTSRRAMAEGDWRESFRAPEVSEFSIDLRGYSREDIRDVCDELGWRDVPLARREAIFQRTGGSPYLVRWLLRGGEPRAASLEAELAALDKPSGFERLVREDFEARSELERHLVGVLTCAGRALSLDQIAALLEATGTDGGAAACAASDEGTLRDALARLARAGWIVCEPRADGVPQWRGESIGSLSLAATRATGVEPAALHARVARWFLQEASTGMEEHWFDAFEHALRSGVRDLAVESGMEAARVAEERAAFDAAVTIRGRLLEIVAGEDEETWASLCQEQATMLAGLERYHEAIDVYQSLLSGRFGRLDPERRARFARLIGNLYGVLGDYPQEMRTYIEGLREVEHCPSSVERLKIFGHLARAFVERGSGGEGREYLERCLGPTGNRAALADEDFQEIQRLAEEMTYAMGDYVEVLEFQESLFDRCSGRGDVFGSLRAAEHLAHLHSMREHDDDAVEYMQIALDLACECGSRSTEARLGVRLGRLHQSHGRAREALDALARARETLHELGEEGEVRDILGTLAQLRLSLFDVESGLDDLDAHVTSLVATGQRGSDRADLATQQERREEITRLRRVVARGEAGSESAGWRLGELLIDEGALDEAGVVLQQAMRSPLVVRNPISMACALQTMGRWNCQRGELAQGLKFFEKSLERLGPVPEKAIVGTAYSEVGAILREQGDVARGYDYVLRGLRIFLELKDVGGQLRVMASLVQSFDEVGRNDLAARVATALVELASRTGRPRDEVNGRRLLGGALSREGDMEGAASQLARAAELLEGRAPALDGLLLSIEQGWHALRRRRYEDAHEIATATVERAREIGSPVVLADALHLLGVVESASGNRGKNFLRAVQVLSQALEGARVRGRALRARRLLVSLARVYLQREKRDLARDYVTEEATLAERLVERVPEVFRESFRADAFDRVAREEECPVEALLAARAAPGAAPEAVTSTGVATETV